jgi:hypothetical protein
MVGPRQFEANSLLGSQMIRRLTFTAVFALLGFASLIVCSSIDTYLFALCESMSTPAWDLCRDRRLSGRRAHGNRPGSFNTGASYCLRHTRILVEQAASECSCTGQRPSPRVRRSLGHYVCCHESNYFVSIAFENCCTPDAPSVGRSVLALSHFHAVIHQITKMNLV